MEVLPPTSISEHFAALTDPRVERCKVHRLVEIVTIALNGVIRGADDWVAIEAFGQEQEAWPRTFLSLPGGIPSHDTFGRVFARLDPDEFRRCFLAWVRAVVGEVGAQVDAVDGKTLRGSRDRSTGKASLHLVSAWATASGLGAQSPWRVSAHATPVLCTWTHSEYPGRSLWPHLIEWY